MHQIRYEKAENVSQVSRTPVMHLRCGCKAQFFDAGVGRKLMKS